MSISPCDSKANQEGKELVLHGTSLFPVACYHGDLHKDVIPWHWHDELELILISEGAAILLVEQTSIVVRQGEGFFINANVLHALLPFDSSTSRYHSAVFHPRLIGGSMDSIFWQKYIQPILSTNDMKYIHFQASVLWHKRILEQIEIAWLCCANEEFAYENKVRSSLSEVLAYLVQHIPNAVMKTDEKAIRENDRIKLMLTYMHSHYMEQLTVSAIAKEAMISESECLRCFKHMINTSPMQYLKQFRMAKATDFLLSTNDKIVVIAESCGFQDVSYFVKCFRELKGMAPQQYRLMHQK